MRKKLVAMCMAAMMALGAAAPAYAANTSDTEYEFYITATYQRTAARKKTDTTKVYTCYDQGPAQLAFQAWASNGGSSTGTNATTGDRKTAYVRRGVQSSITNKVKEWGYSYAYLKVNSADESGVGSTAHGVWSPDSSRVYTVVN